MLLDELARLYAEATSGLWTQHVFMVENQNADVAECGESIDAALIARMHAALPALGFEVEGVEAPNEDVHEQGLSPKSSAALEVGLRSPLDVPPRRLTKEEADELRGIAEDHTKRFGGSAARALYLIASALAPKTEVT